MAVPWQTVSFLRKKEKYFRSKNCYTTLDRKNKSHSETFVITFHNVLSSKSEFDLPDVKPILTFNTMNLKRC